MQQPWYPSSCNYTQPVYSFPEILCIVRAINCNLCVNSWASTLSSKSLFWANFLKQGSNPLINNDSTQRESFSFGISLASGTADTAQIKVEGRLLALSTLSLLIWYVKICKICCQHWNLPRLHFLCVLASLSESKHMQPKHISYSWKEDSITATVLTIETLGNNCAWQRTSIGFLHPLITSWLSQTADISARTKESSIHSILSHWISFYLWFDVYISDLLQRGQTNPEVTHVSETCYTSEANPNSGEQEEEKDVSSLKLSPEQEAVMKLVKQHKNVFFTGNAGRMKIYPDHSEWCFRALLVAKMNRNDRLEFDICHKSLINVYSYIHAMWPQGKSSLGDDESIFKQSCWHSASQSGGVFWGWQHIPCKNGGHCHFKQGSIAIAWPDYLQKVSFNATAHITFCNLETILKQICLSAQQMQFCRYWEVVLDEPDHCRDEGTVWGRFQNFGGSVCINWYCSYTYWRHALLSFL